MLHHVIYGSLLYDISHRWLHSKFGYLHVANSIISAWLQRSKVTIRKYLFNASGPVVKLRLLSVPNVRNSLLGRPWSSLVAGDEGWIDPSRKLLCLS